MRQRMVVCLLALSMSGVQAGVLSGLANSKGFAAIPEGETVYVEASYALSGQCQPTHFSIVKDKDYDIDAGVVEAITGSWRPERVSSALNIGNKKLNDIIRSQGKACTRAAELECGVLTCYFDDTGRLIDATFNKRRVVDQGKLSLPFKQTLKMNLVNRKPTDEEGAQEEP